MSVLTEAEVLAVLDAIQRGDVTFPEAEKVAASKRYTGDVTLHASNGWTFVVFNDCNDWDYLSEVTAPDGRSLTFDQIEAIADAATQREGDEDDLVEHLAGYRPRDTKPWGFGRPLPFPYKGME